MRTFGKRELFTLILTLVALGAIACSMPQTPGEGLSTPSPAATPPTMSPTVTTAPATEATPALVPTVASPPIPAATTVPETPDSPTPVPPPAEAPTATPVPSTATPAPTQEAQYGGTLNLVSRENIAHQDVHQDVSPALATWGPGIAYSRLMRFRSGPNVELPSLAVECELCEGWTMLNETTFEFDLRDDVRWQDIQPVSGRGLTAEDVAFSYNRQRRQGFANAPLLHILDIVEAPAKARLRLTLLAPDADFMMALADGHSKIVAREAVELSGDLKNGPTIGSGPWILTDTRPNIAHTFERNPDYFEEGLPYADSLVMHIITDPNTRRAAFSVGSLDVSQMGPQEWAEFQQQSTGVQSSMIQEAVSGLEVAFKTTEAPFNDVDARRAALLAMNPWNAIEDIWLGAAYVKQGVPPLSADWLLTEDKLQQFFDDPQRARQLLQESSAEVPVTIKVGDFGEQYLAHAQQIADEMREVGFDTEIEVVNQRQFGEEVWLGGDYQMFVGPIAPVSSPNGYLFPLLHSQGQWNTTEHQDAALDALIEAQAQEFDPQRRKELILDIQRHVLENAYRAMPAAQVSIWAYWPRVQNFYPNFAGFEYSHWARVWLR
jgi:peptide/nickel transport system substrate-binding protein